MQPLTHRRRPVATRGAALVVAVVVLGALAAAPVGARTPAKKVPPDQWVADVCTTFGRWIATTGDIDLDVQSGLESLAAGDTNARRNKALTLDLLDEAIDASADLVKQTKAAGTPRVTRGALVARKHRATTVRLSDIYRDAREAFAELKTRNDRSYLDKATKVADDTTTAFGRTDFPLDQLARNAEIDAAMAQEPACQRLNADFPTVPFTVGDCLDVPADATPTETALGDFILGSCDGPHAAEVFSITSIPAPDQEPFPGQEAIVTFSETTCVADFEAYVGLAFEASIYEVNYFTPIEATWELGDREVICLLTGPDATLAGPARGSAI